MADITHLSETPLPRRTEGRDAIEAGETHVDLIELFFFAYRDFVGDPDEILSSFGFGRAHHRVLHFVNRNPGMRVTDLLDILRITKQSLGRVLRELVDEGFVESRAGSADRRQRLLYPTAKGAALAREFMGLQSQRIAKALEQCGPGAEEAARRFLVAMIDTEDRAAVERLIERAQLPAATPSA
ncbi:MULTISPECIES: MarR family winged helix-turn-helix transcriptional regulator [Azorhizobium]|uniref:Regulatory protein n=1 Tax=Azorhizobium caulinodans (strain ATCC 43989 / DSM 5975 / JCM 20966 / LMG 6465 / NBRC 14845 / NCIMB 13405 / ORS 571) TaxID=438753 RepID=A8IL07_AZOC5|nr:MULTISPECIES: MarR family transcriptional regulator [Azorhizobium]TDU00733.1 DNA-binding MarR family transcriptional regulator [Azorhizobium sp. AG788]BAF89971.1 regulatory protein [Azorhizobium caulinodans ORS 571]